MSMVVAVVDYQCPATTGFDEGNQLLSQLDRFRADLDPVAVL